MSDKKFTDEEIIRNYEWCIGCTSDRCRECTMDEEGFCEEELQDLVLDLIKRQKAENDSAKAKIEICAEVIERQGAEIKRVKECPKCVYEYDGEVTEYCVQGPCSNFKTVEQIKAEAYKEFADALRKHYDNPVWYLGGSNGFFDNLDSLVKEMLGEE